MGQRRCSPHPLHMEFAQVGGQNGGPAQLGNRARVGFVRLGRPEDQAVARNFGACLIDRDRPGSEVDGGAPRYPPLELLCGERRHDGRSLGCGLLGG